MPPAGWILIEPDGTLRRWPGPARTVVPARLGHPMESGEGLSRVRLGARFAATAWIIAASAWYPRNPVASCLLLSMGAPWQVVSGPVAVTGWGGESGGESEQARVRGLLRRQFVAVETLHRDIVAALAGHPAGDHPDGWAAEIRGFAVLATAGGSAVRSG